MTQAIKDKIKGNLEMWAIAMSLLALIVSPAVGFVGFKVAVESDQKQTASDLSNHEERIKSLETERISLARALGRLEEQATQTQRTLERIETSLGRAR